MSGGGGNTQTVEKAEPWWAQAQQLQQYIYPEAQRLYKPENRPEYFPGQTVAAPGPTTTQAQQMLATQATGPSQDVAGAVGQAAKFNLTDARDVNSNPYIQAAMRAAIQPAIDAYSDSGGVLSQIRSEEGATGIGEGYGSRGDIARGLATARLGRDILGTTSTMAAGAYQSGLDASKAALATAPQYMSAMGAPAEQLSAVGAQQDTYQQALLDEARARWEYEQNLPLNSLAAYQSVIQGNYGGERTSTGPSYRPSTLGSTVGGAAAGYAVGASYGSSYGPYGAAAGALLGYLMSQ
jgi:hypothetical protein